MQEKMRTPLFFAMLIAMVALFAATGAMAQDRPTECVAGGKYTMTPSPDFEFPSYQSGLSPDNLCGEGVAGWAWRYRVTPKNSKWLPKINKAYFYIPSSPPNIIEVCGDPYRGEGGTSGWGALNYNGIVVTTENISGGGDYIDYLFCTKEVTTYGVITAVIDTGEGELGCVAAEEDVQGPVGGIVGPGFDVAGFIPAQLDQVIQLGTLGNVCAKRHPATGCIKYFYDCDDPNYHYPPAEAPPGWATGVLEDCGDLSGMNRHCRECIFLSHESPGCYWAYISGTWICLACYPY